MSKPIVLITSAAGRIGRELIARLAQEGKFTIRACYFSDSKADYLKSLAQMKWSNLTSTTPKHGLRRSMGSRPSTPPRSTPCSKGISPFAKS